MAKRPDGLGRFADKLVLGFCVLSSLWLLTLDEETRVRHASRWAQLLATPVEWAFGVIDDVAGLRGENQRLRATIAALELDASQIALERERIEELERRAGFFERSRGHLVPAQVLELIVSRIPIQAKIQTDDEDSLRVWEPVVTERGLVGRVRELLGPDRGLVELLTAPDARISVEAASTGVTGLLRYDGHGFLMDHVPQGDPIAVGDRLITSGLGGTVPRGIPVGVVNQVLSSAAELFQHVEVEPAVRFSALRHVYVVRRPGPWYSLPGDTPATPDSLVTGGEEGS